MTPALTLERSQRIERRARLCWILGATLMVITLMLGALFAPEVFGDESRCEMAGRCTTGQSDLGQALSWVTVVMGMLLFAVGDLLQVRSTLPVAEPKPLPSAAYPVVMMASLLWAGLAFISLWTAGWMISQWQTLPAVLVPLLHLLAWLLIGALGECRRRRLVRALAYPLMLIGLPVLALAIFYSLGPVNAGLAPILVTVVVLPLAALGLLNRIGNRA